MSEQQGRVTSYLEAWAAGDASARDRLVPVVYGELKRLAGSFLKRERPGHTLQPTALVNEALLRLYDQRKVPAEGRGQLMALLATLMRRVLVDHARRKRAQRRDAGKTVITFDEARGGGAAEQLDVIELNLAIERLAELDPRQARVVELRFFGGFEVTEVAEILGISPATVKREWRTAKIWLYKQLRG